jgi:NADH dehydrogenase/NADH:ubiquinone oxidoreductase subunit G
VPEITLDGNRIEVGQDTTILEAARSLEIAIPTLCYHPAVEPGGNCRLCTVEVIRGGRSRLVTACNYPIQEDGLEVKTQSERTLRARKLVVELLLARSPNVEVLKEQAELLGIDSSRFAVEDTDECILCGLCTRVCSELIGARAIGFVGRGVDREVETAFRRETEDCTGCGACAIVCPTGAISVEDIGEVRKLARWHTEVALASCPSCGEPFAPTPQLQQIPEKNVPDEDWLYLCPTCRRKLLGRNLSRARMRKAER